MTSQAGLERLGHVSLVAAAVLAAGCIHSTIRVAQAIPVEKPRQRIYVIVHEGAIASRYARELSVELAFLLDRRLVTRGMVLTDLEFDSRPMDSDIAAFEPESVLVIKPIGTRSDRYGGTSYLSFGATLHDHPSNQTIWAAKAEIGGDLLPMHVVAKRIVGSLADSRMIPTDTLAPRGPPPMPRR